MISRLIKYQAKSNEKYMPFLHWFSSFEGNSCKNLKDTATTDLLFLVVFIRRSFYISRYQFSKTFRSSFNIIWKINFQHEFSIFNKLNQAPSSQGQNVLSMTKDFLLMVPYYLPTTSSNPNKRTARGRGVLNLPPPLWFFEKRIF